MRIQLLGAFFEKYLQLVLLYLQNPHTLFSCYHFECFNNSFLRHMIFFKFLFRGKIVSTWYLKFYQKKNHNCLCVERWGVGIYAYMLFFVQGTDQTLIFSLIASLLRLLRWKLYMELIDSARIGGQWVPEIMRWPPWPRYWTIIDDGFYMAAD